VFAPDVWSLCWFNNLTAETQHERCDDDDDDVGGINFSVALSPKTTRTRNNKPKQ